MCAKTLNPKAPEWRPPPTHRRLSIPHPHYDPGFTAHAQSWPLCEVSSPTVHEISGTAAVRTRFAAKKAEGRRAKGQNCPPAAYTGKSRRIERFVPPRLRRAGRRSVAGRNPPPPCAREWRPKKPASAASKGAVLPEVSGGEGGRASGPCNNTTVMIKNIPNRLRRDFLLQFLDDYSRTYNLEYDFFYLPMDFRTNSNYGYAFVNFTTNVAALKFKNLLHNFMWGHILRSHKVCDITWARIQGRKSLTERFKNTSFACDELDFLPVILDPPRNGSNPNPPPPLILGFALKNIG